MTPPFIEINGRVLGTSHIVSIDFTDDAATVLLGIKSRRDAEARVLVSTGDLLRFRGQDAKDLRAAFAPTNVPVPAPAPTSVRYKCGCSASGPGQLPDYCPEHGK